MSATGDYPVLRPIRLANQERAIRLVLEDLGVDPDELINSNGESRLERYLRKLG